MFDRTNRQRRKQPLSIGECEVPESAKAAQPTEPVTSRGRTLPRFLGRSSASSWRSSKPARAPRLRPRSNQVVRKTYPTSVASRGGSVEQEDLVQVIVNRVVRLEVATCHHAKPTIEQRPPQLLIRRIHRHDETCCRQVRLLDVPAVRPSSIRTPAEIFRMRSGSEIASTSTIFSARTVNPITAIGPRSLIVAPAARQAARAFRAGAKPAPDPATWQAEGWHDNAGCRGPRPSD